MSDWSSGYVVDVTYTHGFYGELAPSFLAFAALLQGYAAPGRDGEPVTYCELGCGQGRTVNLLAGANPQVQFYANDFNPAHIAGARNLARTAKLSNVHFFDDSFAEFVSNRDLPPFDIVSLHGIYSWISEENRSHIVRFIKERLKPGGLVYISYNAMPGWAPLMPLRRMLAEYAAAQGSGNILKRIEGAVSFLERLEGSKARYFGVNPKAAKHAKDLKARNRSYLAHEYFNRDFNAFYFADIAREMSDAKLTWIGSATVLDSFAALNLTPEQQKILEEIDQAGLRETIRDHMVDQTFRRDLFVKGPVTLSKPVLKERWLATRFALTSAGKNVPRKVRGSSMEVEMQADIHEPLIAALHAGPKTLGELLQNPLLGAHGLDKIRQAVLLLVGQGTCRPCLPAAGEADRRARARAYNGAVAERAIDTDDPVYLASGTTGGGLSIDRVNCLVWLARHRKAADIQGFVWDALERSGQRLTKDGTSLDTREAATGVIAAAVASFDETLAPVFANLGIS